MKGSTVSKHLRRAQEILSTYFNNSEVESMVDYITCFNKTMFGETKLRLYHRYLLSEGICSLEAEVLIVKSFNLEHGSSSSQFWN